MVPPRNNNSWPEQFYCEVHTVYVQIFEACKFRGCHKPSIFVILFSRITKYPALWFMQVKVRQWNFKDENFVAGQFTVKTLKITSLENLYVYGSYTDLIELIATYVLYIAIATTWVYYIIIGIRIGGLV